MFKALRKPTVLLLLSALILAACSSAATPQAGGEDVPVVVDSFDVIAEGRLVPLKHVQLSFATGGQVADVLVEEGETVAPGQVLARLGGLEQLQAAVAQAELGLAQARLNHAQAQLGLLNARQALDALYENAPLVAAEAQLAVARAEKGLEDKQHSLNYALNPLGKSAVDAVSDSQLAYDTALANLQLTEAGPLAQAVNAARDAANQAFSLYQDAQARYDECNGCNERERDALLTAYQNAQDQLAVAQLELETSRATQADAVEKAQDQLETAQRNLAALEAGPDEMKVSLAEAELAMAETTLADALARWETVAAGPDPDELEAAGAAVAQAEAHLAQAEVQIAQAEVAIVAAEAALDDAELRAPFAGAIADLNLKAGEQVGPGQVAVVLADFSSWRVETDNLTEIEVPEVFAGQPVTVAFDALPDLALPGEVTFVSPLFESKRGDVTYTVQIALDALDPRLKWGMTAVATFEG